MMTMRSGSRRDDEAMLLVQAGLKLVQSYNNNEKKKGGEAL
jgi:hypothetical protein